MENIYLNGRAAKDIEKLIERVLKDLGITEPPLPLDVVRDLLRLDKAYYSSTDHTLIRDTVHRLKVAGQQVVKRPGLMWEAIRKFDLKALYVPDRNRILIDAELPSAKQRWSEAHEIGHSVIPWHEAVMHGDEKRTLSLACQAEVEAEANYAAARLLFLGNLYAERLLSGPVELARVRTLSKEFGNSITTTLWRTVEAMSCPACAIVSQHPRSQETSQEPVRYFVRSREFARRFGNVNATLVFATLKSYCTGYRGPLGDDEVVLLDTNGVEHIFYFETFFNGHDALTLGVYRSARLSQVLV